VERKVGDHKMAVEVFLQGRLFRRAENRPAPIKRAADISAYVLRLGGFSLQSPRHFGTLVASP
jgi:hypothetical protein